MVLGLTLVVLLLGASLVKAIVGPARRPLDDDRLGPTSSPRTRASSSARPTLLGGIDFIVVAIGVFALGEVSPHGASTRAESAGPKGLRNLLRRWQDLKDCRFAFVNGSVVGFFIGVLPGAGATIASFISYGVEKAFSSTGEIRHRRDRRRRRARRRQQLRDRRRAGTAAHARHSRRHTTAILLGGLVLWGFKPGPLFIQEHPALFWGLVASMYIGNVMLLVLNLPLVPLFAQILRTPCTCCSRSSSGSRSSASTASPAACSMLMLCFFGLLGYLMRKLDFPAAPLILGLVLGDPMERALRQSLMMSAGDLMILVNRPISATLLLIAAMILCLPAARKVRSWRVEAIERES